jgi:uncharacterized protein (TIGR02594 family)
MDHMKLAFKEYGVKEITGELDNPRIVQYFDDIGFDGAKMKDETAWCSCFTNWVAQQSSLESSGALNARSWLNVGTEVETPEFGDIVIFWRGSPTSWKGHVAFYINHDENNIYVLGGNQGNQVCIRPYPIDRLLQYRRLT